MLKANCEYTDTYGGEPNYSWVRRASFPVKNESRRSIMRQAKKALGLTGMRGKVFDSGDLIEFRPFRSNTIAFISFEAK